ncbi:MAG: hypothetical protein V7754_19025 [Halioglobus sp.]
MTSMPAPDYYCEIDLSEKEFLGLAGFDCEVDIFCATQNKPVKGYLVIPGGGRFIEDGKTEAWLWIDSPSAKINRDTIVSVSIVGKCAFGQDYKGSLAKQIMGKKYALQFVE